MNLKLIFLIFNVALVAKSEVKEELSLKKAMAEFLTLDSAIQLKKIEILQAKAEKQAATERLLVPEVFLGGNVGYRRNMSKEEDDVIGKSRAYSMRGNLGVNFNLYKGGSDVATLQNKRFGLRATDQDFCEEQQKRLLKLTESYIDYLISIELLKIAQEYSANAEIIYRYSEVLVQGPDQQSIINLPRARAELSKSKVNYAEALNSLNSAKNNLENLLDRDLPEDVQLQDPDIPLDATSKKDFVSRVLNQNHQLKRLALLIKQSHESINGAYGGLAPTIDLSGQIYVDKNARRKDRGYSAGVDMKWTVYNPEQVKNLKIARLSFEKSKIEHGRFKSVLLKASERFWHEKDLLARQIYQLKNQVKELKKAMIIMEREIKAGVNLSQIDLLRGGNQLLEARQNLVTKEGQFFKLKANMSALEGKLGFTVAPFVQSKLSIKR